MAVVEVRRDRAEGNHSYEGRREASRIRLTSRESATISYVFSDWDSEIGLASNFGVMAQALASKATPETETQTRRRAASREPQTAVPKADLHTFDVDKMSVIELWCMKKREARDEILRCWRALCAMGQARDPSLIVLFALYGDRPPGLPAAGRWPKDVDQDYRRVVRYADGSGGSGAELDALMASEKHRPGEALDAFAIRRKAGEVTRKGLLVDLGRECERMIVAAAGAYRAALRAQP